MDDLLISLSGRMPFTPKALDIILMGGIHLPTGKDQAKQPNHSVTEEVNGSLNVVYRQRSTWGSGIQSGYFGGQIKYRFIKSAITISGIYTHPLGESKGLRWEYQFVNNSFEYKSQSYSFQLPDRLNFSIEVERQLSPWFDLSMILRGESANKGWEEVNTVKFLKLEQYFLSFNPGYEILVTPKLWLRQRLSFALTGRNTDAPFTINTSLVYNFFIY
jgi:hypothetical protein